MKDKSEAVTILVADDDLEDQVLIRKALEASKVRNPIVFVNNGEELINYLRRIDGYEHLAGTPFPGLVFLDLNMPLLDGREALKIIKSDPELKHIPVVVLTTSDSEEDIFKTYNLGVNSFITKPRVFEGLVSVLSTISGYWFEVVKLPGTKE